MYIKASVSERSRKKEEKWRKIEIEKPLGLAETKLVNGNEANKQTKKNLYRIVFIFSYLYFPKRKKKQSSPLK